MSQYIVELMVKGYRAISMPIVLRNLDRYVALFGDNAVGKSSLLRAVVLLGRLCEKHPTELLGSGRPWPSEAFFDTFGEDPLMFNSAGTGEVQIVAKMTGRLGSLEVAFTIQRWDPNSIRISCDQAITNGTNLMLEVEQATSSLRSASAVSDPDLVDQASARVGAAYQLLHQALEPVRVAIGQSPSVPVPDPTRAALFDALSSTDIGLRNKVRAAFRRFGTLFPALGAGEVDVLGNPPTHPKDLAWLADSPPSVIDLDHLGGGVQSTVATVASLVLSRSPIVCLEEPEAFVGARALMGLSSLFREATRNKLCEQIWVATHAVTLVGDDEPIVVLEKKDGIVAVRQGSAAQLGGPFSQPVAGPTVDKLGRLGQDGSVRLPAAIIERTGLRPGDFVYFVDEPEGARILTGVQMDATLSTSAEK